MRPTNETTGEGRLYRAAYLVFVECMAWDARGGSFIVLLTKPGPQCISFRCEFTASLVQGVVHEAEADVADPVFVRSTIAPCGTIDGGDRALPGNAA